MSERRPESGDQIDPEHIPTLRLEGVWLGNNNCRCGLCHKYFSEKFLDGIACPEEACSTIWKNVIVSGQRTEPVPEQLKSLPVYNEKTLDLLRRQYISDKSRIGKHTIETAHLDGEYL